MKKIILAFLFLLPTLAMAQPSPSGMQCRMQNSDGTTGQKAMGSSVSVAIANNQTPLPIADSSGGFLSSDGAGGLDIATANPLTVNSQDGYGNPLLSDVGTGALYVEDTGVNSTLGSKGDPRDTHTDGSLVSVIAALKQVSYMEQNPAARQCNAGTNLNTSALALESGGNLATLAGIVSGSKAAVNLSAVGGTPLAIGQHAMTSSLPVVIASDNVPVVSEGAGSAIVTPWTQNLKQLNGTTTDTNSGNKSAGTLRVVLATDQPALTNAQPVSIADGSDATLGAKADAKNTATDTTAISIMSVLKEISAMVQAPPSQAVTNAGTFAVQAAQSGTWTVQPGNTANTTAWKVDNSAVTQPVSIAAPTYAGSSAYEACHVLKASAGTLYLLTGFSSDNNYQWVQLYNTTSAPANGATPAVPPVYVGPMSNFSDDFGARGHAFSTGITVCNSTTGPTKTGGAADTWFGGELQ